MDSPTSEPPSACAAGAPRTAVGGRVDFSASLDAFQGPLDLLLYLIKESEVEITAIPIAKILEQYLRFIDQAAQTDLQLAGEFLVMAATLMEIKSRELLPAQEQPLDGEEIIEDPRSELVRQLLEYRKLKDQARLLEQAQEAWQRCRPRGLFDEIPAASAEDAEQWARAASDETLLDVQLYDLYAAYERILSAVLAQAPGNIVSDEEPLEVRIARIEAKLRAQPLARFMELVSDPANRAEVAATFVALLELVRRRAVRLIQAGEFGGIDVKLREEHEAEALSLQETAEAEALETAALQAKSAQAAALEAEGGADKLPWAKKRLPPRPKFAGLVRPEDVEELDAEEAEIGQRIDAILAAADASSERFEQSREGRMREELQDAAALGATGCGSMQPVPPPAPALAEPLTTASQPCVDTSVPVAPNINPAVKKCDEHPLGVPTQKS